MALKMSLVIAGDAAGAEKALADTSQAMAGAEKEAQGLTKAYGNADKAIGELARAQSEANEEIQRAKAALNAGEIGLEQYNRSILETKSALSLIAGGHRDAMNELRKASNSYNDAVNDNEAANENFAKGSKAATFAAKNLNFQLMDMAQGLALGMPPMMILMQQVPQAAGAFNDLASASGGAGNAIAGLAAKYGPLIAVAGTAAAVFGGFAFVVNAEHRAELDAYAKSLGLTKKEMDELGPITVGITDVFVGLGRTIEETLGVKMTGIVGQFKAMMLAGFKAVGEYSMAVTAAMYAGWVGTYRGIKSVWGDLPAALGDLAYGAANATIDGLNWLLRKGTEYANKFIAMINGVMANIPGYGGKSIDPFKGVQLDNISNPYAGAAAKAGKAFADEMAATYGEAMSAQRGFFARWGENAAKSAMEGYRKAADAKGFLDPEKAQAAGKKIGEDLLKGMMDALEAGLVKAFDAVLAKNAALLAKSAKDSFAAALAEARANGEILITTLNDAARPAAEMRENFAKTADYLDRIGGKMGTVAGLIRGVTTGDFSGIGGKAGALADLLGGISWQSTDETGERFTQSLKGVLMDVFSKSGAFGETMNSLLQGAGTGSLVGSVAGFDSKSSQMGATVGGAVGQAFAEGSKMLGKTLGSAAGPLGAIAGSLIGGLIGGVLSKTKKGSATLGFTTDGIGTVSTSGNSKSRITAASSMGDSIGDILANIEDQLGVDIGGQLSTSIGIRKKNYVVDTTGQGRTKGAGTINFGQDQEAAIKAALKDILSDATLDGISEGFKRLLQGGSDIEKQLQKVLTVKAVFDKVDQAADPLGFAQAEFEKEFAKVKAILDEAGASAEEYAKAETWAAQERADIVEEANRAIVEKERDRKELEIAIMSAEGDAAGALKATRDLERQSTEASLIPLKERYWALQDEAELAAKVQSIADERYAIETRLLQAMGDKVALNARELATVDESNRALLASVYAYEAQKEATEAATRAAEEAAAAAKSIADERATLEEQLLTLQGNTAELERRRLETFDPSNRALAAQITAEQALADARETAAARTEALAQERYDLEGRYLQAIGDKAAQRAREMDKVNPENRDVLQKLYAYEDAQTAAEALKQQREETIAGYKSEAQAMASLAEKLAGLANSIRAFRDETVLGTAAASEAAAQAEFSRVAKMAALGDETALGNFTTAGKTYLDAAMRNARSTSEYRDAQATVAIAANAAIGAAERQAAGARGQADWLGMQTALLETQGDTLATLSDTSSDMAAQLAALNSVQADGVIPAVEDVGGSIDDLAGVLRTVLAEIKAFREEAKADRAAAKAHLEELAGILRRTSRGTYLQVGSDAGAPLLATVTNTADAPLFVDQV